MKNNDILTIKITDGSKYVTSQVQRSIFINKKAVQHNYWLNYMYKILQGVQIESKTNHKKISWSGE